jgi:hypothetical protein
MHFIQEITTRCRALQERTAGEGLQERTAGEGLQERTAGDHCKKQGNTVVKRGSTIEKQGNTIWKQGSWHHNVFSVSWTWNLHTTVSGPSGL